jgi:hypothetical protein
MAKELANLTEKVATPIIWHDPTEGWPRRIYGGTCFFLRFADSIVGVTADHVVGELQKAIDGNSNTICQIICKKTEIRTSTSVDLPGLIIDRSHGWDIATFRVSEELVEAIGATPLDCRGVWPPPEPKPAEPRAITYCGFPEAERVATSEPGVVDVFACCGLAKIEDVTERDLIVTYDPALDEEAPWAPWKRPPGYNMSGCSGGPVLSLGMLNGLQRWFPIAMIIMGPREEGTGEAKGWDMIWMRRIDAIEPDGTIKHKDSGRLPR